MHGFDNVFFEECANQKLTLFNLVTKSDTLKFEIRYSDKKLLLHCAEKAGVEIIDADNSGLPEIIHNYRLRWGIPIGLFISFLIIGMLSSVLWSVDISGNKIITDETLYNVLDNYGVASGVFLKHLDSTDIEFYLSEKFKEFSRVAVHIAGSRMFINVKERNKISDMNHENSYSNIVASKNGEIIRADIYAGSGKLEKGTAVVKGDLLVSGIINFRDGRVRFTDAEAEIWAYTENNISAVSDKKINVYIPEQISNKYSVIFFGLNLPVFDAENSFSVNRYFFDASSVVFPIGAERFLFCEMKYQSKILNNSESMLMAFSDYAVSVMSLRNCSRIIKSNEKVINNDIVGFDSVFQCVENIAVKKIFTVEDCEQ